MDEANTCTNCSYSGARTTVRCPECGSWTRVARGIRRRGWVLVVLGLMLAVMMIGLIAIMAPVLLSARTSGSASSFTGTQQQATMILGLFALILIFGLACVGSGVWQIVTGRRSILIVILILGLAFALVAVALSLKDNLKRKDNSSLREPRTISNSSFG